VTLNPFTARRAALCDSRGRIDAFLDKLLQLNGMGCACATDTMHAQQPHPQTTATAQDRRTPGSPTDPLPAVAPAAAAPVFTEEQEAFGAWLEGEAETDTKGGA
jgi:hypothetical protein